MTAFPQTPITGVIPWGRQGISGAQNLSGGLRFLPAHWGLASPKLHSVRFKFCAWLYRTNSTGAGYAVGATLAVARKPSPWGKVPSECEADEGAGCHPLCRAAISRPLRKLPSSLRRGAMWPPVEVSAPCRAREGELPCKGKRDWPGPRLGAPLSCFTPGDFAACGRRVPLPMAAKEPNRPRGRVRWATAALTLRLGP